MATFVPIHVFKKEVKQFLCNPSNHWYSETNLLGNLVVVSRKKVLQDKSVNQKGKKRGGVNHSKPRGTF